MERVCHVKKNSIVNASPNVCRALRMCECAYGIQLDFVRFDFILANSMSQLIDTLTVKAKKCSHPLSLARCK